MSRRSRVRIAALLVVLFVVALTACASSGGRSTATSASRPSSTSGPTAAKASGANERLLWHRCQPGDCATLRVPLDPAAPGGPQIDLAVARASTAKAGQRIGSLLINPGGPGASGVDIVGSVAAQLPASITDRFDVVAWDPRGTGRSAPVRCGTQLDFLFHVDTAPDSPAELTALEGAAHRFVKDCVARTGDRLRHIASADTVQDMDRLRAALGDAKLTYLGLSYGTYLGGLYATTYPGKVRALVLDGALDPTLSVADVSIQQAKGFDASLEAFFGWCRGRASCTFHAGGDPRQAYDTLAATIDARPIATGSAAFGPTQLDIAVAALLYGGESGYNMLATGLTELEAGISPTLQTAFDVYMGRSHGGRYDTQWAAFIAISCADGPNLSLAETEALQRRAAMEDRRFGAGNVGLGYPCAYWPYPPTRTGPVRFSAPGAPPIVVVGTRGDPATPLAWAEGLASQLGQGRLVSVTGTTHTSSLNGNQCLDALLTGYLVDLVSPPSGSTC